MPWSCGGFGIRGGLHSVRHANKDVVLNEQLGAVAGVDPVVQGIVVVVEDMAGSEAL